MANLNDLETIKKETEPSYASWIPQDRIIYIPFHCQTRA